MKRIVILVTLGMVLCLLASCSPAKTTSPQAGATPVPYTFSERGSYLVGKRSIKTKDPNRNNRPVSITIWYPAVQPAGATTGIFIPDAGPDLTGAPYPLILSSTKVAWILAPYLVSHGFTWASVDVIDSYSQMNEQMFNQPLDILFALDQVASNPPEGLEGMINSDKAGAIGYSFDGYNALALSGARIDPAYYLKQCPNPNSTTSKILSVYTSFNCGPAGAWEEFAAHAGEAITASPDGLWQPMTDARIRAVMPMAAEGWWLFGKKGLAVVDRPVLIIDATGDALYPENALIYKYLGTPDKTFISFVGQSHMKMVEDNVNIAHMAHFAAAFFGYHLQGRADLAWYFSEDFVDQHDDLVWGVTKK